MLIFASYNNIIWPIKVSQILTVIFISVGFEEVSLGTTQTRSEWSSTRAITIPCLPTGNGCGLNPSGGRRAWIVLWPHSGIVVVLEEKLWWLSFVGDGHHTAVPLEVEPTVLTEDCLIGTSMVPVSGGLRETMAAGIVAVRVCECVCVCEWVWRGARKVSLHNMKYQQKFGGLAQNLAKVDLW